MTDDDELPGAPISVYAEPDAAGGIGQGYRPLELVFVNGPYDLPTPRHVAGSPTAADLVIILASDLRLRGWHRTSELVAVALVASRTARSVHVMGNNQYVRKDLAKVLATAYPDLTVTWSARRGGVEVGQRLALRSSLATRRGRPSRSGG